MFKWTVSVLQAYMGAEHFQFCCNTVSCWFKDRRTKANQPLTLGIGRNPSIGCSISVWKDQG